VTTEELEVIDNPEVEFKKALTLLNSSDDGGTWYG
jgi:hypothetical protein